MSTAALRCAFLAALAWLCASCSGADAAPRAAPSRPGATRSAATSAPLPTRKIGGVECVSVATIASRLGLKLTTTEGGRVTVLSGPRSRAELESDTRDVSINGLRVFLGDKTSTLRGDLYVSRIDFERCVGPLLQPGYGAKPIGVPKVIVLDPGHGGKDFGKINDQLRINEKTFALDTARRVKQLLEADGYRVILTRDDDRFLELAERPAVANANKADLFVSIHFNALATDRKTSGVEVYTFAPQHQRSTEAWMPGQKDDTQDTPEPANDFDQWNVLLAESLHRTFVGDLDASDRGKKLMHLGVLRPLRCPGALLECGFLSSDIEARKIATPAYRQKIAKAIRDGIRDYAATVEIVRRERVGPAAATSRHARPPVRHRAPAKSKKVK